MDRERHTRRTVKSLLCAVNRKEAGCSADPVSASVVTLASPARSSGNETTSVWESVLSSEGGDFLVCWCGTANASELMPLALTDSCTSAPNFSVEVGEEGRANRRDDSYA